MSTLQLVALRWWHAAASCSCCGEMFKSVYVRLNAHKTASTFSLHSTCGSYIATMKTIRVLLDMRAKALY